MGERLSGQMFLWGVLSVQVDQLSILSVSLSLSHTYTHMYVFININSCILHISVGKYKLIWFLEVLLNSLGIICSLSVLLLSWSPSPLFWFPFHITHALLSSSQSPPWFLWLLHVVYSHVRIWSKHHKWERTWDLFLSGSDSPDSI